MAKTTKAQKHALEARDAAGESARAAKQALRDIPGSVPKSDRRKVKGAIRDAKHVSKTSKRAVRRDAAAVTAEAEAATKRLRKTLASAKRAARLADPSHRETTATSGSAAEQAELGAMTVAELRLKAKDAGLTGYSSLAKADLLALFAKPGA
ncbi:hypothetical protein Microterr_24280 [Microbacterium terricola]|uniref:Rho termination factor N-terminal domain-containing protein n=2 Tax=Microbacterium terricola TaxID=344163 RepID=A0ABM8E1E4_9MICO|nr:hypothetical protein Microterr_24280 [Microbacterium terricola]